MFQRVVLENWHSLVPYICFALIGGSFIAIVIRALLMKRGEVDHAASLPLRDDPDTGSDYTSPKEDLR